MADVAASSGAAVPSEAETQTSVNFCELYKQYCADAKCRVNSAVLGFIAKQPNRPLEALDLANNYVGAKGLMPILRLIEKCQTITVVNLRGNGLDNAAIAALCKVLEHHLGISSLDVSSNPLTLDGGRSLMHLVEANRRIIDVKIENTDIFDSLAARLQMVTAENYRNVTGKEPHVVAARPLSSRPRAAADEKPKAARITPVPTDHSQSRHRVHSAGASPSPPPPSALQRRPETADVSVTALPGGATATTADDFSGSHHNEATQRPATSGPLKPRPPPPAVASREASRMSELQKEELRQRYKRRAEAYHSSADKSPASQMADALRQELALLEAAERRRQRPSSSSTGLSQRPPSGGPGRTWTQHVRETAEDLPAPAAGAAKPLPEATAKPPRREPFQQPPPPPQPQSAAQLQSHPKPREALAPLEAVELELMETKKLPSEPVRAAPIAAEQVVAHPKPREAEPPLHPQKLAAVGAAEQFRQLFNLGCQQYNDKQLDAAYLTWQEAVEIATREKSREWMAIVTQNLRRLGFEMRAAEGAKCLEAMKLDEADVAFHDALAVAIKANNAAWEAEMRRAIKNVMHTRFQRAHKDATAIADRLKAYVDQVIVDDDDRFVPATTTTTATSGDDGQPQQQQQQPRAHTGFYFNEWNKMLMVKEAVELWADAADIARKIGGSSVKVLLEVVGNAIADISQHLWNKKFVVDTKQAQLARFGMHALRYDEAVQLRLLWTDLYAKSKSLNIVAWECVCQASLGHLAVATNTLQQAIAHFETMLARAVEVSDAALEAAARTYLGLTLLQRSDHSRAEAFLLRAIEQWRAIRSRVASSAAPSSAVVVAVPSASAAAGRASVSPSPHNNSVDSPASGALTASPDSAAAAARPGTSSGPQMPPHVETRVSAAFASHMATLSGELLVKVLVGAYRYRQALEVHESTLLHRHDDILRDKIVLNFTAAPTLDHISAIGKSLGAPIFYLTLSYRFEWNAESSRYDALEQLLMWVVPREAEIKFVQVEVTLDFQIQSIAQLIAQVRDALHVDPQRLDGGGSGSGVASGAAAGPDMHLTVPELQWKYPLQQLYNIIVAPVIDFLQVHVAYSDCGLINVIPSGALWALPFSAMMCASKGTFLVEQFALTFSFCAMQAAYAALSATRVRSRNAQRRIIIAAPCETDTPTAATLIELPFALDVRRCAREGDILRGTMQAEVVAEGATSVVSLRELLPTCRVVHIATPISADATDGTGGRGAMCVSARFDEIGLLHSSELSAIEMPAELVTVSNSTVGLHAVVGGAEGDGALTFTRALLNAGAAAVVSPLWCAPDMIPAVLFDRFFVRCRTEPHKAKALTYAIRAALTDDGMLSPRQWAGLMMFGVGVV